MALRKLQAEIDKTLKAVDQGVEVFESTFDKLGHANNSTQKDKLETDLKTQIKKLQRMRDQIKMWLGNSDIKDKSSLLDHRKLIESQMERFKALEKEMKMKAFSKEGLIAAARLDPAEKAKRDAVDWIGNMTEELSRQIEQTEAEMEILHAAKKKKSGNDRLTEMEELNERRQWHIGRLEIVQRMLENGQLSVEQVESIQEDVKYFTEDNAEEDFDFDNGIYDELNLQDVEEEYGVEIGLHAQDESSNVDSASTADPSESQRTPAREEKKSKDPEQPPSPVSAKKTTAKKTTSETKAEQIEKSVKTEPTSGPPTSTTTSTTTTQPPVSTPAPSTSTSAPVPTNSSATASPAPATSTPVKAPSLPPIRYAAAAAAAVAGTAASSSSTTNAAAPSSQPTVPEPVASPTKSKEGGAGMLGSTEASLVEEPQTTTTTTNGHGPVPPPGLALSPPTSTSAQDAQLNQQVSDLSLQPQGAPTNGGPSTTTASTIPSAQNTPLPQAPSQTQAIPTPQAIPPPGYAESSRGASGSYPPSTQQPQLSPRKEHGVLGSLMHSFDMAKELSERRAGSLNELHSDLDVSFRNLPQQADAEPPRYYHPQNPVPTPSYYPQTRLPILEDKTIYQRLELDQLFYIFYYMTGTYEQWLAAQELKRQSWRFHKQYLTWFQRAHNPQAITEDYEQGGYYYFDWENAWCQRKKSDFRFEYRWLSDH